MKDRRHMDDALAAMGGFAAQLKGPVGIAVKGNAKAGQPVDRFRRRLRQRAHHIAVGNAGGRRQGIAFVQGRVVVWADGGGNVCRGRAGRNLTHGTVGQVLFVLAFWFLGGFALVPTYAYSGQQVVPL